MPCQSAFVVPKHFPNPSRGPQLEEVAGEHELDAAEGRLAAAQLARRQLQALQELGGHHADLVNDQHLRYARTLRRLGFAEW